MHWFKLMEAAAPYLAILFVAAWFTKIINYSIFDYYQNSLGRIGSLLIGTFTYYKKYELSEEADKTKKISKLVNNICGYVMLAILAIAILFIIMIFN